jgi:hypothetical protein
MANSSEKSQPPSDSGDSNQSRFQQSHWFDTGLWLGFATVLAFSTAWLYVHLLSLLLQLGWGELARCFDLRDYPQTSQVGGITFLLVILIVFFFLLSGLTKFFRMLPLRALLPAILMIAVLLLTWRIAASEAARIKESHHPASVITLKGDYPPIQGDVMFSLSRYVLIYAKQQYPLVAVPQAEIRRIETPTPTTPQK